MDSLQYNSETCQSVCLYVCPRHFLNRPASLISKSLLYICQLKNPTKGGVTVEIKNAAYSINESPYCTREVANLINIPICPSATQSGLKHQRGAQPFQEGAHQFQEGAHQFQEGAHQFQEGAPEQDAPPNYYTTVNINSILEIPPAQRNPFETREVVRYMCILEILPVQRNPFETREIVRYMSMRKPSAHQPEL